MKKKLSIVLVVVLTLTLLLTSLTFAGEGKNKVAPARMVLDASLSEVSTVFDTPKADLEVATSRACTFKADTFLLSSIVDKNSKQAYMVSTDAQGKVWIAKPKIEGELIDRMSQMKPDETVTVSIWAMYFSHEEELQQIPSKYPDVPFDEDYYPALGADVSLEVLDAIEADMTEIKLRANEESVQPVVDFLQSTGHTILYVSKYAPSVSAELSKEDIYMLARLPEVYSISLPLGEPELCLNQAHVNINAEDVWAEGYDGGMSDGDGFTWTRVAVVDSGVDFTHQALAHADGGTRPGTTIWHWHGTAVAGCVASDDATFTGIAPGTLIMDANYQQGGEQGAMDATEWALPEADVINLSSRWTADGEFYDKDICRYFDHVGYVHHTLTTCAAGNDGHTDEYVGSPANAYNVLAVGGIDDQGDLNWNNDTIAGFSSWRNPVDRREKPEVCAPAVDITMPSAFTGNGFRTESGTSFAAPQVAGIAAMLIERDTMLSFRPAVLKAIIMAGAIHNVVPNPTPPYGVNSIDDHEGVGTVDAYAAYKCVDEGNYAWIGRPNDDPFYINFYARAGQRVRFVINVRAHTPADGFQDYGFWSDFDFFIQAPFPWGYWRTYYSTIAKVNDTNPWEIIEFTAEYTGTHRARIWADRFDSNYDYVAAAWYVG